jgi:hypothetical protein
LAALIAYWAFSVPAWNFYYGPIPFRNKMDTYSAINRAERAIPWNNEVLQFKKTLFALDGWWDGWMESFTSSRRPLLYKITTIPFSIGVLIVMAVP